MQFGRPSSCVSHASRAVCGDSASPCRDSALDKEAGCGRLIGARSYRSVIR